MRFSDSIKGDFPGRVANLSAVIGVCLALAGCSVPTTATVEPSAPAEEEPAVTLTVERRIEPSVSPSRIEDDGPLAASGPWRVFSGLDGLWVVNSNGSGLTHLTSQALFPSIGPMGAITDAIGRHLAYLSVTSAEDQQDLTSLSLNLLTLPSGESTSITPLFSESTVPGLGGCRGERVCSAVIQHGNLAWSPDGKRLAFISAHQGPSADLYVYSLDRGAVTRLTTGATLAIWPRWSPDGNLIIHLGVHDVGTGAGMAMDRVWIAHADGSEIESLYTPQGSVGEQFVGWWSPRHVIVHSFESECGNYSLRAIDVRNGEVGTIWAASFRDVAMDPATATILFSTAPCAYGDSGVDVLTGLYLVDARSSETRKIGEQAGRIEWIQESEVFLVELDSGGALTVSSKSGEVIEFEPPPSDFAHPVPARGGRAMAWESVGTSGEPGIWVGTSEEAPTQVFNSPAKFAAWGHDGEALLFFGGQGLTNLYLARDPQFLPELVHEGLSVHPEHGGIWMSR